MNHKLTVIGDVGEEQVITERRIIAMTKTVPVAPQMITEEIKAIMVLALGRVQNQEFRTAKTTIVTTLLSQKER